MKPILLPDMKTKDGKVSNGAHERLRTPKVIVVHYTGGSTIKDMLNRWRAEGKANTYITGTNYSVAFDGSIIEWADPIHYTAQSTVNANAIYTVEDTVAIDFLGSGVLTNKQIIAGSALLKFIQEKCSKTMGALNPLPLDKYRLNSQTPPLTNAELLAYNVFPHCSFGVRSEFTTKDPTAHKFWTECSSNIDLPALCKFIQDYPKTNLKTVPDGPQKIAGK